MRILLTNNALAERAGTELYLYDVATALRARGHQPVAYSNRLGAVAESLRAAGVPVIERLEQLSLAPDIIHGHHHLEVMSALLHFPHAPAVLFCHSWKYWEEMPVRFPRIHRYVAMNEATFVRLTCEHGVPEAQVTWIPNFVDLARFQLRAPLPTRPRRALVFSSYLTEQNFLPVIRAACARAGLSLDVIGLGVGQPHARPWEVLGDYDLVFASGRSALEALAVGAAVIICNVWGLGPMVTAREVDRLRRFNFGFGSGLNRPCDEEEVLRQIARYDAADAAAATQRIRATAGLEATVDQLLALYRAAIAAQQQTPATLEDEARAAAGYLRQLAPRVKQLNETQGQAILLQQERDWFTGENEQLRAAVATLNAAAQRASDELRAAGDYAAQLERQLEAIHRSRYWRGREMFLRLPGVLRLYRLARRLF